MRILAIDTSTMFGSVALCDGDQLIAEEQLGVEVTHSERLLGTIDHLLQISKWGNDAIEGVAVAIGPGSFTGLRIGLATAKGLALGLQRPIAGASSLLALAYNGIFSEKTVVSVIDARRAEVYAAAYKFEKGKPKCVLKDLVCDPDVLSKKLASIKGGLFLVGDGVVTYEKVFRNGLKNKAAINAHELKFPHASYLARIASGKLKRGGDDIVKLVPNYLRHSDAEIGFKGKK
jgi:tRNA threonylcarbamoyladenosine biosynthesis protein TsaB